MHFFAADMDGGVFVKQSVGDFLVNRFEIKRAEATGHIFAQFAHFRCHVQKPLHQRRRLQRHMFRRGPMRDDLRVRTAAISVAVVAIVMRVHHHIDVLGCLVRVGIGRQHVAGQRHIEKRVDNERLIIIDDKAGVRPAPAAIGLQPSISAIAKLMQAFFISEFRMSYSHDKGPPAQMLGNLACVF